MSHLPFVNASAAVGEQNAAQVRHNLPEEMRRATLRPMTRKKMRELEHVGLTKYDTTRVHVKNAIHALRTVQRTGKPHYYRQSGKYWRCIIPLRHYSEN